MIRENINPKGPDLQIHMNFEDEQAKKRAIEDAGYNYDLVKDQVSKNIVTGEWEKKGIPLSNLKELYNMKDSDELYNKDNIN